MSLRLLSKTLLLAGLAGFTACSDDAETIDAGSPVDVAFDAGPLTPTKQLDVLLVIDDSSSMAGEQAQLAASLPSFVTALTASLPTDVSLHLGVINTSLAIEFPILGTVNCTVALTGDGALQDRDGTCLLNGNFLHDEPAASGTGRENNAIGGDVAGALACLAQVGEEGCGFEQPLEAMRLALAGHPDNLGFLRQDAALLVLVLSDEDDCSASDQNIFDPGGASFASELGPMYSFRCTEFGVTCAEGKVARTAGSYTACEPAADSYLHHPSVYRDFLVELKGDARRVAVMSITGDTSPFKVQLDVGPDGKFAKLESSCMQDPDPNIAPSGAPAVRLRWFTEQFAAHAATSICANEYELGRAGLLAAQAMGLAAGE